MRTYFSSKMPQTKIYSKITSFLYTCSDGAFIHNDFIQRAFVPKVTVLFYHHNMQFVDTPHDMPVFQDRKKFSSY